MARVKARPAEAHQCCCKTKVVLRIVIMPPTSHIKGIPLFKPIFPSPSLPLPNAPEHPLHPPNAPPAAPLSPSALQPISVSSGGERLPGERGRTGKPCCAQKRTSDVRRRQAGIEDHLKGRHSDEGDQTAMRSRREGLQYVAPRPRTPNRFQGHP
ncbi:hypothetical protein Q8A67_024092 [Cirrhinus molitorella]|uniref:Uncharacterized protein n=1 Tax=Cirrhinus molitorella TaxID=172907 RepID=A0AA88P1C5_9TELE|nr:hypothetical protein Q8A67_024092 [Cirrhinus molitorella]